MGRHVFSTAQQTLNSEVWVWFKTVQSIETQLWAFQKNHLTWTEGNSEKKNVTQTNAYTSILREHEVELTQRLKHRQMTPVSLCWS